MLTRLVLASTILCLPFSVCAQSATVDPSWNLRLRHERVDDDAFSRDARADTLRLRAGLGFAFGDGWTGLVEGEGVVAAGDSYNSGANQRTRYPAVVDPEGVELNQAWIGWQKQGFATKVGRQRILLDNQRWVGNVGWRQNEQTFDAVSTEWKIADAVTLKYDWLASAQRFNGDQAQDRLARERSLDTHLVNLAYIRSTQQWTGYAYLHRDHDVAAASSATYGMRWTGKLADNGNGPGWTLEVAQQRDHGDSPADYSHRYWLIEPTYRVRDIDFRIGWEHLGGNGSHALQTPLATLHAFDGWADKFVVTPSAGLEDRYVSAGGKFAGFGTGKLAWNIIYHDFRADSTTIGDGRYGREWDASLGVPLAQRWQGLVKLADYRSDGHARDTTKIWLQLELASVK